MKRKDKNKEQREWLKGLFPTVLPAILTSFTTVLVTLMTLLANGKTIPLPKWIKAFSIPFEVQFGIILFLTVFFLYLTFSSARNAIVRYRDSQQEDLPSIAIISRNKADIASEFWFKDDLGNSFLFETGVKIEPNMHVSYISNPLCFNKEESSKENVGNEGLNTENDEFDVCHTELTYSKTFLGRYIYKCDRCNNKIKSKDSVHTLRSKAKRVVLSEVRNSINKGEIQLYDDFFRRRR